LPAFLTWRPGFGVTGAATIRSFKAKELGTFFWDEGFSAYIGGPQLERLRGGTRPEFLTTERVELLDRKWNVDLLGRWSDGYVDGHISRGPGLHYGHRSMELGWTIARVATILRHHRECPRPAQVV
jgi:hypothetical protein